MLLPLIINNAYIILAFFTENLYSILLMFLALNCLCNIIPHVLSFNFEEPEKIDKFENLDESEDIYEVKVKKIKKKKKKKNNS